MPDRTIFVSYSHDTPGHTQVVLQLANALRGQGVDVELDQYHVRPPQRWPRWCEEQLRPENAAFVLVVCTSTYRQRVEGKVPANEGRGVFWEGGIIYSYLYNEKGNSRFIPVLLPGATEADIPRRLCDTTRYSLKAFDLTDPGYRALYRELTGQPAVIKPALGDVVALPPESPEEPKVLPPLEPRAVRTTFLTEPSGIAPSRLRHSADELIGRETELRRLSAAWNNPAVHLVTIVAWGGVGKTALVAHWQADLAASDYDGASYFDWSFYSQGTREQGGASSDSFIVAALEFFGDADMARSAASPWDKGARLAQLVAQRRTLLVLDGLEPLQHPPGPLAGQLKDPALAALLKGLAQRNPGLCLVTTRERVADLASFRHTTAPEWPLEHLSTPAGVELLKTLGVRGTQEEFTKLVEEVRGHALTLNLLGRFLRDAHGGDIRRRDLVEFEEADAEEEGGHAFRVIAAYEKWFASEGKKNRSVMAILRLLGLFDRPAEAACLGALKRTPAIAGLTEPLVNLSDAQWNLGVARLAECGLVFPSSPWPPAGVGGGGEGASLDSHPLIRKYSAKQLRAKHPEAWRAAHRRLYEHLTASVPERPDTLEGIQPLYQAVAHGCQAGIQQEACDKVYGARILRGDDHYSWKKLGSFASDLGAVACFFEVPWSRLTSGLSENRQAWVLSQTALYLRALGRLTEAIEPMRAGLERGVTQKDWSNAAVGAHNLSELQLTLGETVGALGDAEHCVVFADRSDDAFRRMGTRAALADALHQAGRRAAALARFREAEQMQAKHQREYPLLYSVQGFKYCDLLLAVSEGAAWAQFLSLKSQPSTANLPEACRSVEQRAAQTLKWAERSRVAILAITVDHLTLGRAALYAAILEDSSLETCHASLQRAVDGLRRAARSDYIPRGLLTRAWLRFLEKDSEGARADLDEACEIAERGPMRLFMADVHLHRARLFHAVRPYPWQDPRADLAAARALIERCAYLRRKEELEDAEQAAKDW
jgi:hypothetical protein